MSETKHTPGPWRLKADANCLITDGIPSLHFPLGTIIATAHPIPPYEDRGRSLAIARANAALIVRAPEQQALIEELVEALQNLAYHEARISPPPYGHSCRWCGDCVQRAKDDARAALAKAEARR